MTPAVFLHGIGRSGRAAWPLQLSLEEERACLFLPRLGPGDPSSAVVAHLAERLDGPVHVVAHSYGALAALLLAERHRGLVVSLALAEPAALGLSRGRPRTEEHVAAMGPVLAGATDEHLRATTPPWQVEVSPEVVSRVPTLVALGGPGTMYAEVAAVLKAHGADVLTVPGTGHRPQDAPAFGRALAAHWRTAEAAGGVRA